MIQKYLNRIHFALNGIKHAALNDLGFRSQLYFGALVLFVVLAFLLPLDRMETLFIILSYFLILITELQNSAIEAALDQLHPGLNDHIGISKDMAAGAVLLAGLFLLITLVVIGWPRI